MTFSREELLEAYRRLRLIRRFEERVAALYRDGEVPGFVHLSVGQEASAVGACWHLRDDDVITSNHRGHGHCLAKGLEPESMIAELMARSTGTNHGRAGSMHVADPAKGIYGANGIVGAGMPIAVGAATSQKISGSDRVTVAFFGDGAVAQGTFHESLNLASVHKLPVVFFCENNGWAEFSKRTDQHAAGLAERALGYGVGHVQVDGSDVVAVADAMGAVIDTVRRGDGPVVVESITHRARGHYEGDAQKYRDDGDDHEDPIEVCRRALLGIGVHNATITAIDDEVETRMSDAIDSARTAAPPDVTTVLESVTAPEPAVVETAVPPTDDVWKMMDALRSAMSHAMEEDGTVFLVGVDVAEAPFAISRGLVDTFGRDRVRDTPISESAIIGTAIGAAMDGMRPVAEIMYVDFIGVCFDQIMNQAAKLRYMTGGRATIPLVIRTQFGAGRSSGSQHSQSLEALLAHIPGLTVVMPSNPADAYGLLRTAIESPNPVVFIENRLTYGMKGPVVGRDHRVPLGKAAVVRNGRHVTVVTYSRMVQEAMLAASELSDEGIDVEIIDLRTVAPIDWATISESVTRTSRLVVVHEAVTNHGLGAEIAARAASDWFWKLDAPVARVGAAFSPPPYAPQVEKEWLPNAARIVDAVRGVVRS